MSVIGGCSQPVDATLYLERRDGVYLDGSEIWSRFHCGREDGVMGSLASRGIAEGDWAGVWQAVVVYSFSGIAARRDTACAPAALEVGVDALGARDDIQRDCGASIGPVDGEVSGSLDFEVPLPKGAHTA